MGLGFLMNSIALGLDGITFATFGLFVPLIIGYPLFLSGFIPAGDVKLFMALGAMNGLKNTGLILVITLLSGGIYSILLLLKRKDFSGLMNFYHYLKEMVFTRKLRAYDSKKSIKFPLAPVTFISYLLFIFLFDML